MLQGVVLWVADVLPGLFSIYPRSKDVSISIDGRPVYKSRDARSHMCVECVVYSCLGVCVLYMILSFIAVGTTVTKEPVSFAAAGDAWSNTSHVGDHRQPPADTVLTVSLPSESEA